MKKIRVLLADDHTVVRQGLRMLLETDPGITVVGEAETGRQALDFTKRLRPDVVVMDISMPQLNGLEATRQIVREHPGVRILILSSYEDDEYVRQMTEAGAVGYLLKRSDGADVIKAVFEVSRGNAVFSPAISKRLLTYCHSTFLPSGTPNLPATSLTSREAEVLQLVAEGQSNKQIAGELFINVKTVDKHRQQLMNKLNIHDIAGLTRYAISKGVIESGARLQA
jgi:DNA-binding NarL/FixJ family response regulator